MLSFKRLSISLLAVSCLVFAGFGTSFAATTHTAKDTLTVKITKASGTVWGKVTVDYKSGGKWKMLGSCKKAKCKMHPPAMVKLQLKEKPVDSTTWPFKDWKVKNGGKTTTKMGKKLKFEIKGSKATVKAIYVLA